MNSEQPETTPSEDEIELALRSFWNGSPAEFDRLVGASDHEQSNVCALFAEIIEQPRPSMACPASFGGYRVLREIGCGGMAVVYEAVQEKTGRKVALKVVRRWGDGTGRRIRLFRREIDSLARLEHPHIATLFDAGQTPDGHHFFAMELVSGETMAEFIARQHQGRAESRMNLRELLAFFCRICRAINYAHQRGVLHCDLKPSNILVVTQDGSSAANNGENGKLDGTNRRFPKILDFGLARLLDADEPLGVSAAESNHLVGTIAYMSPEQTRLRAEALDIRSDVYSLGVVLYELLTARPPYPIPGTTLPDAIRMICETVPNKPRVTGKHLGGDIETIVLKALEKDPERRYQSAAELSDDIERFLANQPILAKPPSAFYLLRKLIARNKLPAALTAAMFSLAAVFAVLFGIQAAQVSRERDKAQYEALRAEQINEFLAQMLTYVDPNEAGPRIHVRELLDQAASALSSELGDQPEIRASLHDTLGRSYLALKLFDQAEEHLKENLELSRTLFGETHPRFANSLHQMGVLGIHRGRMIECKPLLTEALRIRRALLGNQHIDVAESLHGLADWHYHATDYDRAEEFYRESLDLRRELPGEHRAVADTLHGLGLMLVAAGQYEKAEPVLAEALDLRRRILGPDHFDVARTLTDLGEIYFRRSDYDLAAATYLEQIRILRGIFGEEGNKDLAIALSDLANVHEARGELATAEAMYRDALEMERRVARPEECTLTTNNYAVFLTEQGRYSEAEPLCREVYRMWGGCADEPQPARGYASQNLADVLLELGDWDEADRLYRDAISTWNTLFDKEHPKLAKALIGLGRLMELRGNQAEAAELFAEALEVRRNRLGADSPLTAVSMIYLAESRHALGDENALALAEEGLGVLRNRWSESHPDVAWALGRLAAIESDLGMTKSAAGRFQEAIRIERSIQREMHPNLAQCLLGLGEALMKEGDNAAARPLLAEALAIQEARFASTDPRVLHTRERLGACLARLNE